MFFIPQRTLVDTNPYLLGITMVVTLVHTVFEFLAFKNGKLLLFLYSYYKIIKYHKMPEWSEQQFFHVPISPCAVQRH